MYVLYVFGLAYCCNVCTDTHLCANYTLLVDVPQFTLPEKASGSDKGEGDAPYASANTNSNIKSLTVVMAVTMGLLRLLLLRQMGMQR
jgi:hypothetical protein